MKATNEQIAEWQDKYGKGNIRELSSEGKFCYVTDPSLNLAKMKAIIAARRKSAGHMIDAIINNCWIAGDDAFKTDEQFKLGVEEQFNEIMELPDCEVEELANGNVKISVTALSIEVRRATRMDIRYAEDRDKDDKPLAELTFLLERIAVNQTELDVLRTHIREYIAVMFECKTLKDKKHVELKKY